jgi:hypothetical protein
MKYRIRSLVGPCLEGYIYNYSHIDEVADFFQKCQQFFFNFKHVTLFLIPKNFIPFLYSNPKMRIIAESIESDTQSNVIFCSNENISFCSKSEADRTLLFPSNEHATTCQTNILGSLNNRRIPLLIDLCNDDVVKLSCEGCDQICNETMAFKTGKTVSEAEVLTKLNTTTIANIHHWHLSRTSITESDIKQLAFLIAIINDVELKNFKKLDNFCITDACLKDIRENMGNDFGSIAFSMFRAMAFPSVREAGRHRLSIDWHLNDPSKCNGYDLYRVDVVDPRRSGVSNSGVERLLLAKKDGQSYFVYYTSTHDFVKRTIKERMEAL